MSHTLNPVDHLGKPFSVVDEQVFVIPEGGYNEVGNRYFKFICLLQGACWHQIDDGERIRFEAGDVLVITKECRQFYWPITASSTHRVHALRLIFDTKLLSPLPGKQGRYRGGKAGEVSFISFIRQNFTGFQHLRFGGDRALHKLLADMRKEAEERLPGFRFRVTALCTELVVMVARRLNSEPPVEALWRGRSRPHLIEQAQEYLVKNLDRELSLVKVAGYLKLSEEHLARVFKKETGQTVFGFLLNVRIEKAKTYLLGSEKSITEIAASTGFSSVFLFSRSFKREVGLSPLAYRQQRWNEAAENFTLLRTTQPSGSVSITNASRPVK